MSYSQPARTTTRRIRRIPVAGLLVAIAAITAALGYWLLVHSGGNLALVSTTDHRRPTMTLVVDPQWSVVDKPLANFGGAVLASSTVASPTDVPRSEQPRPQLPPRQVVGEVASPIDIPRGRPHLGALGEDDGVVPDGVTVFDHEIPGVANLDPALLGALRQAATAAADDGVEFFVNSGWRSPEYQNQLLREAISTYGSEREAARWVATADTSPHVSGHAADIGPLDATAWLSEHGAKYGLCQIYSNEPWHYELRPEAIDHGCPPMYADPTHDPRMQQ